METAKADAGKLKLSLVPCQIIKDIAEVREYGCKKYHDPENWRQVEVQRYIDAFYRHWLKFVEDPTAIDEESGRPAEYKPYGKRKTLEQISFFDKQEVTNEDNT